MANSPASSTQTLGHYALRQKLGEGATGQVWLAHDKLLDREVAIKLFNTGASDKRQVQDFLREAQSAAKLNHPNTVTIYEIGRQGDQLYIAMEYLEAGSLSDELRDTGVLPWREATQAIRDAAAGLQAAHERGMVHRDIKPSNLMRSARGMVKVVDFGLAKAHSGDGQVTQTIAGALLGSPAYMSPEQCRGDRADARSDLYSLICSYYHLLTRQTPFDVSELTAAMYKHCYEPFPDVRATGIEVPDGVVQILERGSQKEPNERYQTAAELIDDLDTVLHTPEVSHTFDRKGALSAPQFQPQPKTVARAGGSSIGSILRGKGVGGKTTWVLAIALAAAAIAIWQNKRGNASTDGLAQAPAVSEGNVATTPVATASVIQSVPPATGRVVDLLNLIQTSRDHVVGNWKRVDSTLAGVEQSVIQVPYHPPAEYDFRVVFSPGNDSGHGLNLICSKGSRMFAFTLGTQYFCDAFSNVKGNDGDATQNPTRVTSMVRPSPGQRYTIEVRVRNDRVAAFLGGKLLTSYKTDYSDLSIPNDFEKVKHGTLGLATCDAPATIYSAEAVERTP